MMQLITDRQREQLLANGADPDGDHQPVVKIFNPYGSGTWLITQMDPNEHDILFGLADLGMGCPEVGSISFKELNTYRSCFGLGLERDRFFLPTAPLSVYAEAARNVGHIVEMVDPFVQ